MTWEAEQEYITENQALMSNYDLAYVNPEDIDSIWIIVEDYLQKALDRNDGEESIEDIYDRISSGRYQLWVMLGKDIKSAIVTEIYQTRKKIFEIILLGGEDMKEWINDLEDQMTSEAKSKQCDMIKIIGREGWLKMDGFEKRQTIMVKQL